MEGSIFSYTFIQNSLLAGSLVALVAPVIGQYLIIKRFSALADTLSHVSLVGIVISLIFKLNPIISAVITTVLASFGIEFLSRKKEGYNETILTLFLTGGLALTSILISLGKGFSTSIYSYLFGSINTISTEDIYIVFIACALVLGMIFWKRKQLFIVALDQEIAKSQNISPRIYNTLIMIAAAFVVSVGIQIIGVLLISSLMILPVITSMLFKSGFYRTMLFSCLLSIISVWLGIIGSFYLDIATGGLIVAINIGFYICSNLYIWQNKKYRLF